MNHLFIPNVALFTQARDYVTPPVPPREPTGRDLPSTAQHEPMTALSVRDVARMLALAAAYAVTATVSLQLGATVHDTPPLWPAAGIAIAALCIGGVRLWPVHLANDEELRVFSDEREAVDLANAVDFGLVAGVWSTDYPRAMRVARRIRAGTVWIWDNYAQPVEGIWGGYKQSGMGRELGYHGLNDFMEVKQIFTDGTGLTMKPPYGQVMKE